VLRELGDLAGAEDRFLQLLQTREKAHFASVDAGLQGYKARHNLAVIYREQGRPAEAEAQWQVVLAEEPGFVPGGVGLGELYLGQQRFAELVEVVARLQSHPQGALEAAVLRARAHLARQEFPAARQLLEAAVRDWPQALAPRVILSHVLLQEGRDWAAAEQALRDVLALDPNHAEARHNLALLLQQPRP
jgi:tetratricopeptide (TPR) repeat protein